MDSHIPHIMNPQLSVPVSRVRLPKGGMYAGVFAHPEADAVAALIVSWCKGVDRWRGFAALSLIRRAEPLGGAVPLFADHAADRVATGLVDLLRERLVVGAGRSNRTLYPTERLVELLRRHGYVS